LQLMIKMSGNIKHLFNCIFYSISAFNAGMDY
jgi:hypothetical protein